MANTLAPFGFSQYRGTGSAPTFEQAVRSIALTAAAIYSGDPVTTVGADGTVARTAAGGTIAIAGIFVGCKYVSAALGRTVWSAYWPGSGSAMAGTTVEAYLITDPNAQFLVQSGTAAAIGPANIGENVDLAQGTGSAITGISGAYVNQATLANTATLPFRVVAMHTFPAGTNGTDSASANNMVIVAFNNVETRALIGIV